MSLRLHPNAALINALQDSGWGMPNLAGQFALRKAASDLLNLAKATPKDSVSFRVAAIVALSLSGDFSRAYLQAKALGREGLGDPLVAFLSRNLIDIGNQTAAPDVLLDSRIASQLSDGAINQLDAIDAILRDQGSRVSHRLVDFITTGDEHAFDDAVGRCALAYELALEIDQDANGCHAWWFSAFRILLERLRTHSLRVILTSMASETGGSVAINFANVLANAEPTTSVFELWPGQVGPARAVIDGTSRPLPNILLKMPTSAGKTLVAELAVLRAVVDNAVLSDQDFKCVYLVPTQQLAVDIESRLRPRFEPIGIGISELYGLCDAIPFSDVPKTRVWIATPEKFDAMMRFSPEFRKGLKLIVVDECHTFGTNAREIRFELFLERLIKIYASSAVRLMFMSAVMGNLTDFEAWLTQTGATVKPIREDMRSTALTIGIYNYDEGRKKGYWKERLHIDPGSACQTIAMARPNQLGAELRHGAKRFPRKSDYDKTACAAINLALLSSTLLFLNDKSKLVFQKNSMAGSVLHGLAMLETAMGVHPLVAHMKAGTPEHHLWRKCLECLETELGDSDIHARCLAAGVVIDHGDMPSHLRVQMIDLVRKGIIRLVLATESLLQGVDLPFENIVIHDVVWHSYDKISDEAIAEPLDPKKFWNLCGRAGRANRHESGLVLLRATPQIERRLDAYRIELEKLYIESGVASLIEKMEAQWRRSHPGADPYSFIASLAEAIPDWLPENLKESLGELDKGINDLLLEMESDGDSEALDTILSKSLVSLQTRMPNARIEFTLASDVITARVNYIKTLGGARAMSIATGARLDDSQYLSESVDKIHALLFRADIDLIHATPNQHAEHIVELYSVVKGLSVLKRSPQFSQDQLVKLVQAWLDGSAITPYYDIISASGTNGRSEAVLAIDRFLTRDLPWAIDLAISATIAHRQDEHGRRGRLMGAEAFYHSMLQLRLSSPAAVVLHQSRLRSADACRYMGTIFMNEWHGSAESFNAGEVRQWLDPDRHSEMCRQHLGKDAADEVVSFLHHWKDRKSLAVQAESATGG